MMVTQRKKVAKIGYHKIYQVKDMKMVPLFKTTSFRKQDEEKYVEFFKKISIGEGFFFSYTYDLSNSFQTNTIGSVRNKHADK